LVLLIGAWLFARSHRSDEAGTAPTAAQDRS
jgi:hypothetical protein